MVPGSNKTAFQNDYNGYDFPLGIDGFRYSDLYKPERLKDLCEAFYARLSESDAGLHAALMQYTQVRGEGYEQKAESDLLVNAAPHLSDFVAALFGIEKEYAALTGEIKVQDPLWKYKFFVQRRAIKKFNSDAVALLNIAELNNAITALKKNFDI